MKPLKTVRRIVRFLLVFLLGAGTLAAAGLAWVVSGQPELAPWHTVELDEEFTVDAGVASFEEYLALEKRLFAEMEKEVLSALAPEHRRDFNRFHRGSRSDPGRWPVDWNRTIELPAKDPKVGVVLLHGMSDSPYSLRSQATRLNDEGAWVVVPRLPGHGTVPGALRAASWEDMAAVVRLCVDRVASKVGDGPIHLLGYSNGAALAVHHVLRDLAGSGETRISRLALISPSIAITPTAALAAWQVRAGHLFGADGLEWTEVNHEYDPFKYQSFATNAAVQVRRLTLRVAEMFAAAEVLDGFPPVLAFQSAVDDTVSTSAVITGLFQHLPAGNHHLVFYGLNRTWDLEHLLLDDPKEALTALLEAKPRSFAVHTVVNTDPSRRTVRLLSLRPGAADVTETTLDLEWPAAVYSLAHVSLPFPPDDPLYGRPPTDRGPLVHLGALTLRGERGIFAVRPSEMLRQRWNPFHTWQQGWIVDFLGL